MEKDATAKHTLVLACGEGILIPLHYLHLLILQHTEA